MRDEATVAVIIPAFNEEPSIGKVLSAIPDWVDDVIVVDNGSTDRTAEVARGEGARIVSELRRGYGSACLAGIAALDSADIVVFLDGDFSDYPEEMALLVDPIARGEADMVIGSRTMGRREPGALTPQARFGNWLSCMLIRWFWSVSYTDLGPFRAIRHATLERLAMRDRGYGWTVEMQIKAAREGARVREAAVSYRRRIGKSKISGTVRGVLGAGAKILSTIFRAASWSLPGDSEAAPRERLIIFTRYPQPGKTKTRLIPALGPEGAAELQRRMAERAVVRARQLEKRRRVSLEIRYEGGGKRLMSRWLGPGLLFRRQGRGDLGEKMTHGFGEAFDQGMERVVLVGTDCPGVSAELFDRALEMLGEKDLVLGPASDGGYYLIGLKTSVPQLFAGVAWGTDGVLERTMRIADERGLMVGLVDQLDDVDRPEDLHVWERESGDITEGLSSKRVSVIIPTFNEAETVGDAILSAGAAPGVEVVVVDGGSDDGTAESARSAGAKVIVSACERAAQMNVGAMAATGETLVFLHADTRLPEDYHESVLRALARPGSVAGAFELGIDAPRIALRIVERLANWRSRRLRMPYGDQALFMAAESFREMGGFPEIPIMEDFEFVRRMRRRGRVEIVPAAVKTSARHWLALGVLRTTLVNQAVVLAYFLGISPSRIARWYNRSR